MREFSFVQEGVRGVRLVKIELAAKIAPRSHKFNIRAVGRGKEEKNLSSVSILGPVIRWPNTWGERTKQVLTMVWHLVGLGRRDAAAER